MKDDTISRQAAIDAMGCIPDSICEQQAIDALWELPAIEAEPVHGRWIECDVDKWDTPALRCSVCGGGYHLPHERSLSWNYCPNCGAIMDGGENG